MIPVRSRGIVLFASCCTQDPSSIKRSTGRGRLPAAEGVVEQKITGRTRHEYNVHAVSGNTIYILCGVPVDPWDVMTSPQELESAMLSLLLVMGEAIRIACPHAGPEA